jgi:hypothetical protein
MAVWGAVLVWAVSLGVNGMGTPEGGYAVSWQRGLASLYDDNAWRGPLFLANV